ncbi:TIR domain-containing adapter molecule 1 [Embiotoca jacksoni]|uniref:TIR domain-containing adapter molecule 1 n=1 Tax=Embiotoca jacksoni TaxID=100190 RepID=UPI003703CE92
MKMSHEGEENPGTGLREVFGILVKATSERLLSLIIQLGESPEDNIIHALCLIVLRREALALNKLQMLADNSLANHLAEMSGGKLEDFEVHCGRFQALTGQPLATLARIFKVLSEQRLCAQLLRNLAYKRALASDCFKASNDGMEYDHFREEAKVVCGPQFAEWMCSSADLKSGSYPGPQRSQDEGSSKVTVSQDQSANIHCLPSPLQASLSMLSYPTHLEISIPPTLSYEGDKIDPETSGNPKITAPTLLAESESEANNAPGPSQSSEPQYSGSSLFGAKKDSQMDETSAAMGSNLYSHITQDETPNKPSTDANISLPKMPASKATHESKDAEEEEEEIFYAFVILHAPQDADMAEDMKETLEAVIGTDKGATFSEDFAIPGKTTLRCVEDAINNSAYTFLLLTCNFNTRMLEMKTNSALINSINKKHKYNTVIPLLPQQNCMPRQFIPLPLQTIVPLEQNKSFERKIQKALSPAKIERQRKIWTEEQAVKLQIQKRQKHLKLHNMSLLMEQNLLLGPGVPLDQDGGDGRARWQPSNIHIENAQYIMIGNESQMKVDLGGKADKDDSVYTKDES